MLKHFTSSARTSRNLRSFFALMLCFVTLNTLAQDKTKTIGNKPRTGSSNTSYDVVQGGQVGIKMSAGSKPVQLLKLDFHVTSRTNDTIPFKVNVYTMDGKLVKDNFVTAEIKGTIKKYDQAQSQLISVDLSPYNVLAKGNILVAVEFLKTQPGSNLGFACGILNGGTYNKYSATHEWKKTPIVGADFSVLVKKLK
ncbi:hypothetical protein SAMN05216464_101122 [Mucilaginibacter pineti]|uniref:Uncharacterized protein n=1 Tax=Mucilaginibacter pineti TaxID=1391627 RepID=A0A1G6T0L4_9SPHI|nr:hypothetical protein [Mucilaginibacter pineti]SDD22424.1 hypothetical protein SAMN05216464_101122 [Mucilaginibacter pineti]